MINWPKTKSYLAALVSALILLYFSDHLKYDETLATLTSGQKAFVSHFLCVQDASASTYLSARYLFLLEPSLPQAE